MPDSPPSLLGAPGAAAPRAAGSVTDLVAVAAALLAAPAAALAVPGPAEVRLHCPVGALPLRLPLGVTPCGEVVARGRAMVADAAPSAAAPAPLPARYAGVPVRWRGAVRGALWVGDPAQWPPGPAGLAALARVARLLGRAIDRTAARRAARRQRDRLAARMEAFLAAPGVVAWLKDAEHRMVYLSPNFRRTFGGDTLLGRADHEWMPAELAAQTVAADQRVLARRHAEEVVEFVPTPDGDPHEWLSYKFPLAEDGALLVGGLAIDRTVELRSQRALDNSRRSFKLLVEGLAEGVFELDGAGRLRYLNPAWVHLTATSAATALGRPLVEFFAPKVRAAHAEQLRALAAGRLDLVQATVPLPRGDGRRRWLGLRCVRIARDAEPGGAVLVGSLRDATSEVHAARADRRARAQLRARVAARKRELATILLGLPQLIWRAGPDGTPTWFNPQWVGYTGVDRTRLPASRRRLLRALVHPDDVGRALRVWRSALTFSGAASEHVRLRRRDGRHRWFLVTLLAVRTPDGDIRSWYGSCTDNEQHMRDHADLEAAVAERTASLTAQARELARSNRELASFAQAISHDLREPLRVITGFASLLAARPQAGLDAEGQRFVGFMVEAATRMQQLIADLLTYARIGRGGEAAVPVDLGAVFAEVKAALAPLAGEASGRLEAPTPLPRLPGRQVLFAQLLLNLCGNALKFRRPGVPPHVEVTAVAEPDGAAVRLTVADNGIGIPAAHRERIFVIFQRLHTREQVEGTGIGLAICKKIVDQAGGRIWAESGPGPGTRIVVRWPLGDAADGGAAAAGGPTDA